MLRSPRCVQGWCVMADGDKVDPTIARAIFAFGVEVQDKVMASDWPNGWEWHMHPGTWIRVKRDTAMAEYITPSARRDVSSTDDLLGSPVVVDDSMPLGAVELRYADQMMLPLGRTSDG